MFWLFSKFLNDISVTSVDTKVLSLLRTLNTFSILGYCFYSTLNTYFPARKCYYNWIGIYPRRLLNCTVSICKTNFALGFHWNFWENSKWFFQLSGWFLVLRQPITFLTQQTITCLESTIFRCKIESLERCVKFVQS